jgi:aminocarboxymuconate-semialdehyde decarboxylase
MAVIDIHTHTYSPAAEALVQGRYTVDDTPYQRDMDEASRATDVQQIKRIAPKFRTLEIRLQDMQAMGVDVQVVSPAPGQQHYWANPALHVSVSRAQNDHVAQMIRPMPERFLGMGTLPLRDVHAAVDEATRAVEELGLRGFQIDSRVEELELSDRSLDPVYARLSKLRVPLFVHPLGFSHGSRLKDFFMVNAVGQPLEEILATAHFVFGGVLDRFPDLKVCVAHGGGYFPYYLGRMDHTWEVRPEVRKLIPEPPSSYVRRMWFDTCVFRSDTLAQLVRLAGADRVMLGSDYPFDMADDRPRAIVDGCEGLSERDRAGILGGNAQRLFGVG